MNANRAYVRGLARLGKAMQPYLRDAAYEKRELRLPLGEVHRLLHTLDGPSSRRER